jgi:hypothetical protein
MGLNGPRETHPAYGIACFSHITSTHGVRVFDSDILHPRYIELSIHTATCQRDLNRDWIHSDKEVFSIRMSEAQFGALVSSFGTAGVPVTIEGPPWERIELPEEESRLNISAQETRQAADKALSEITRANAILQEVLEAKPPKIKDIRDAARRLRSAIENAPANMKFAADSLTKHTEDVVTKAKADIEAMAEAHVRSLGVDIEALGGAKFLELTEATQVTEVTEATESTEDK